jgi:farnesyl diphosphate synthase
VTLLGAKQARERVDLLADQARSHLEMFGERAKYLRDSVDFVLDLRR